MSRWHDWRIRNLILAAMFLAWGIARLIHAPAELRWSVPVIGSALLQITVAWLFANRTVARADGNLVDMGVASVSLIAGAILLAMLPQRRDDWNLVSLILIAVGSLVTIAALLRLGRSFAIFPARRTLVTGGLYQFIRHPAYAGEMIIMLGVSSAAGTLLAWLLMVTTAAGIVLRIDREERLLSADAGHAEYRRKVRWRLIPAIW